jgi:hypothetical protein
MITYISNELFHLVGRTRPIDHEYNYNILSKILDEMCVTHYPHNPNVIEHTLTLNIDKSIFSGDLIAPKMVCFCDIPFEALNIHIQKYGSFGLSFPRNFLIANGARPVTYVPYQPSDWRGTWGTIHGAGLLNDWENVWRGSYEHIAKLNESTSRIRSLGIVPKSAAEAADALEDLLTQQLAFTKPFNSELPDNDPSNYYMEREWRKIANLPFTVTDIAEIIVHPTFRDRMEKKYPSFIGKIKNAPI